MIGAQINPMTTTLLIKGQYQYHWCMYNLTLLTEKYLKYDKLPSLFTATTKGYTSLFAYYTIFNNEV